MRLALLDAAEAVRTQAEDARSRIDAVVADTDTVVAERGAAGQCRIPRRVDGDATLDAVHRLEAGARGCRAGP